MIYIGIGQQARMMLGASTWWGHSFLRSTSVRRIASAAAGGQDTWRDHAGSIRKNDPRSNSEHRQLGALPTAAATCKKSIEMAVASRFGVMPRVATYLRGSAGSYVDDPLAATSSRSDCCSSDRFSRRAFRCASHGASAISDVTLITGNCASQSRSDTWQASNQYVVNHNSRRRRCRACNGTKGLVTWTTDSSVSCRSGMSRAPPSLRRVTSSAIASEIGGTTITREEVMREDDPANNVSEAIFTRLGMQLHNRANHPLSILKNVIYNYFDDKFPDTFNKFDDFSPIVSTKMNFDEVLVPADHVSRSYNDTYYIDEETVLRCHTSAHQAEMLRAGNTHFLVTGDVYRRDSIDSTHYPVFHQMEGVRVFSPAEWEAAGLDGMALAQKDLKETLEGLARKLFGSVEMRWVDTYFPFTQPSFELEIFFQGEWLEVLGCGVMEQQILANCGRPNDKAWAFGLGLERLAMVLFGITDIRMFWTDDQRFTSQFKEGQLDVKFKPYSKYPPCFKDVSFWISDSFTENNLCEVVRGAAGDLAEEVKLIDNFTNKKGMTSHCYRIAYRSMDRSLTDDEINRIQETVRAQVEQKLKVVLR